MKNTKIIFLLLFFLLSKIYAIDTKTIYVNVKKIRNTKGFIMASLYSSKKGFPDNPEYAVKTASGTIVNDSSFLYFENITDGYYAVSVFHDENANGKMNTNWIGIPQEGVGASNNIPTKFGPPSFKESSFAFSGSSVTIHININYISSSSK